MLISGEAIEDFLKPRLALPKASDVAAASDLAAGRAVGRRYIGDSGVGDSPVDGGDASGRDVDVGWHVSRNGLLLVNLVCGLYDGRVVGRRMGDIVGSLMRKTLVAGRDDGIGRCQSQSDATAWRRGG